MKSVRHQVWSVQVWNQALRQVERQVESQAQDQVWILVRNKVEEQIRNVGIEIRQRLRSK